MGRRSKKWVQKAHRISSLILKADQAREELLRDLEAFCIAPQPCPALPSRLVVSGVCVSGQALLEESTSDAHKTQKVSQTKFETSMRNATTRSGKPYTFNSEGRRLPLCRLVESRESPPIPPQAFPPDSPILAAIPLPTILIQPEVEKLLQNWQQKQLSGENVETRYNWSLAVVAELSGSMFQRKLGIPGFYHCGAASRPGGCRASCCEERPERSGSSHSGVVMLFLWDLRGFSLGSCFRQEIWQQRSAWLSKAGQHLLRLVY